MEEPINGLPNLDNQIQVQPNGTTPSANPNPAPDGNGLPNLPNTQDVLDALNSNMSALPNMDDYFQNNPPAPNPNPNDPPAPNPNGNGNPNPGDFISETFGLMQQAFGEGFKAPENVTKENFLQAVYESLYPSFQQTLRPEVKALNDYLANGGDLAAWQQQLNQQASYKTMPADDLLFNYYKENIGHSEENPDGLSDDQVRAYLSKKDPAEKQIDAMKIRKALDQQFELEQREMATRQAETNKQELERYRNELSTNAKNTVGKVGNISEIYGIPVSPNEVQQFNANFEKLILPDETGVSPAQKILYDDVNLYKLLFIASKSGQIKDILTDAQNRQIQDLKGSLQGNPSAFQSNQAWNATGGVNLDALTMPART